MALGAEEAYYRVDLLPSGKLISQGTPVTKGAMVVLRTYPEGTLISVRKSEVKGISKISPADAAPPNPAQRPIQIGNLAMQGGSSQKANAHSARPAASGTSGDATRWNGYDTYFMGIPGLTDSYPPANAVQSSPGAPPQAPQQQ